MIFRSLLRYLANNDQLVNRMAESYPIRRAAQLVVAFMYRAKHAAKERGLSGDMTPERFKAFMDLFKTNLKKELEGAKDELKKKKF